MSPVKRQHVVSQVVLRQWAVENEVLAVDLRHGLVKPRSPKAEGFIEEFVKLPLSSAVERHWGDVEVRAPRAVEQVRAGTALDDPQTMDTLRSLVALHFIRSRAWQYLFAEGLRDNRSDGALGSVFEMLQDPDALVALHRQRTGLEPTGPETLLWTRNQVLSELEERLGLGGEAYVEWVLTQYERTLNMLRESGLQIGDANEGEFIVGDGPAMTYDRARGLAGVLNGVTLGDADAVFFPLTPKHVLCVGDRDLQMDVPLEFVDLVNMTQMSGAMHKVYVRPGSGLEDWVLAERSRRLATSKPSEDWPEPDPGDTDMIEPPGMRTN